MKWYEVSAVEEVDSPSLLVYRDRMMNNIHQAIKMASGESRLRPHVKTHKLPEVIQIHVSLGVTAFKCATLAEAEMIALNGGKDVLLAHQPVGPKISKLIQLKVNFPQVEFSTIVDDRKILSRLAEAASAAKVSLGIWLDVDNGMHRSGIEMGEEAAQLIHLIGDFNCLNFKGLHVYDGHIRDTNFAARKDKSDQAFYKVRDFVSKLTDLQLEVPQIIAGGSPTFPVHAQRPDVQLSPGTYVFWDFGYKDQMPDIPFECAALLLTRVISKPGPDLLCLDVGHKAVASENPHPRIRLLGIEVDSFPGHSEEHLVVKSPDAVHYQVGDVLYGIPRHICPTVALHQEVQVIENHQVTDKWEVLARNRKLYVV